MTTNQLSSARPTRMLHRHRQPEHRCKPTASRIPVTVHRASQGTSTTTTSPDFSAREHASSTATPPNVATAAASQSSPYPIASRIGTLSHTRPAPEPDTIRTKPALSHTRTRAIQYHAHHAQPSQPAPAAERRAGGGGGGGGEGGGT